MRIIFFCSIFSLILTGCSFQKRAESTKLQISDVGFQTPESVEYYAEEDVYLVTNINGNPLEKDGNGFISKVSPNGTVIDLKWIDGSKKGIQLDAPKGAEILGNKLYVTDITYIRVFELPSGKPVKNIEIKESTFLNGITVADKNSLYITDSGLTAGFKPSGTDAIYQVWNNGKIERLYASPDLGKPNGIIKSGADILVVTFDSGDMFRLNMAGDKVMLPKPPQTGLDGFVQLPGNKVLISSWNASSIYMYEPQKGFSIFASDLDAPADMGLDTKRRRVLVPLFKQNKVIVLPY